MESFLKQSTFEMSHQRGATDTNKISCRIQHFRSVVIGSHWSYKLIIGSLVILVVKMKAAKAFVTKKKALIRVV